MSKTIYCQMTVLHRTMCDLGRGFEAKTKL